MLRRGSLGAVGYNPSLDFHSVVHRLHVTTIGECRDADISKALRHGSRWQNILLVMPGGESGEVFGGCFRLIG